MSPKNSASRILTLSIPICPHQMRISKISVYSVILVEILKLRGKYEELLDKKGQKGLSDPLIIKVVSEYFIPS